MSQKWSHMGDYMCSGPTQPCVSQNSLNTSCNAGHCRISHSDWAWCIGTIPSFCGAPRYQVDGSRRSAPIKDAIFASGILDDMRGNNTANHHVAVRVEATAILFTDPRRH